jgi:hypothetical protein
MFFVPTFISNQKFKLKTLLLNLVFCVLCYFFGFFDVSITSCESGFLTRSIVYGKPYLCTPSISLYRIQSLHDQLKHFLLNASNEQFNFIIYRYESLKGEVFPKKHPYTHPNTHLYVNSYVEQVLQIHVNIQMSHQSYFNFKEFTDYDVNGNRKLQYINDIISLYDFNEVSPVIFSDQQLHNEYLKKNFEKIINYYKNV